MKSQHILILRDVLQARPFVFKARQTDGATHGARDHIEKCAEGAQVFNGDNGDNDNTVINIANIEGHSLNDFKNLTCESD